MRLYKLSVTLVLATALMASCGGRNYNDPGTEYAPQMYVSKAYEPFSQVDGEKNKFNPGGGNMRTPAPKTIARRRFNTEFSGEDSTGKAYSRRELMVYNVHKDSIQLSERLRNPFEPTPEILEEGKTLYTRYCMPCHGEKGDGQGKVGGMYKGVPNYSSAALKNMNGGHIYHVITHGKGRMWAHSSLVNSDDRWKIVYHVHTLQGQTLPAIGGARKMVELKAEKGATFTLNNVLFKSGSNDLEESSKKELIRVIEFMKKNPQVKGEIDGHTDNQGKAEDNQKLSEARAKIVSDFLEANGVEKDRMDFKGYGDSKPKASNDDEKGRALNRRIEFKVL